MFLPLLRLTLDLPILLLTLVLGIIFVHRVLRLYGVLMVGFVMLGVILIQAQWGLVQFIAQHDLGMYLIGESHIDEQRTAVAKFTAYDEKFIRAYGPYAHANSFGGVVVVGMAVAMHLVRAQKAWGIPGQSFWMVVMTVLLLAILVSFSRAAYAGVAIIGASFWFSGVSGVQVKWVPLVSLICVLVFLPLIYGRLTDSEDRGVIERVSQLSAWYSIVKQQPWWRGLGTGAYSQVLKKWFQANDVNYHPWEVEPVHSVPLLVIAEWGWVVGLCVIAIGLYAGIVGGWVALAILPAVLFDHYFITQLAPLVWLLALTGLWLARRPRQLRQ